MKPAEVNRAGTALLSLLLMVLLASAFTRLPPDGDLFPSLPAAEEPLSLSPAPEPEPTDGAAPEPAPEPAGEPTPEPSPGRVYSGVWGEKFAGHFTEGEIIQTENSYRSANVSVTLTRTEEEELIYYVADVYVSDLGYLRSAFANGRYEGGFRYIDELSQDVGAIVAITGDHYAGRYEGIVVRNGELYRDIRFDDVCVLYRDGRMETLENRELDMDALREADPWQVWSFGPALLDDNGRARESFNTIVFPANPRSAIGYVEPGHYYLVEVEGSRGGVYSGSRGMDMRRLAELFESLGCRSAYNLDGGRSAAITWMGERVSIDYGRTLPDIIYVTDTLPSGAD